MDISEFLLARIAEDEEVAKASDYSPKWPWRYDPDLHLVWDGIGTAAASHIRPASNSRTGEHIARHDPGRVLAECEAKRRIIRQARLALSISDDVPEDEPDTVNNNGRKHGVALAYEAVLEHLARPHASHPDYQEDWSSE